MAIRSDKIHEHKPQSHIKLLLFDGAFSRIASFFSIRRYPFPLSFSSYASNTLSLLDSRAPPPPLPSLFLSHSFESSLHESCFSSQTTFDLPLSLSFPRSDSPSPKRSECTLLSPRDVRPACGRPRADPSSPHMGPRNCSHHDATPAPQETDARLPGRGILRRTSLMQKRRWRIGRSSSPFQ